jgi:hypothetical protein
VAKYSSETTINVAPERVFAYVADMTKHGEWGSYGLQVTRTSAADGVGATSSSTAKSFGTQKETQVVVQHDPPRRFAFDATGSLGVAHHVFEIEPSGAGARLTKTMELTKPSFLARVMSPMIGRQQRPGLKQDVERIKERLESSS